MTYFLKLFMKANVVKIRAEARITTLGHVPKLCVVYQNKYNQGCSSYSFVIRWKTNYLIVFLHIFIMLSAPKIRAIKPKRL